MKALIFKLLVMLVIVLSIKLPFVLLYTDEVSFRNRALLQREYDTVLIGSSRTQFGIKPAYFDALNANKITSYNFGISAGLLPYTLDWCEALIKSKRSLRYMIVELTGTGGMARSYEEPWVEFRLRDYLKAVQAYTFHKSSAYHDWLALGFLKPQLSSVKFFDNNMPLERLHEEYSLPTVEISLAEIDRAQKRNLAVATDSLYASAQPDRKLWQRIIRLIALADAAGIRIYFFVPPRLETDNEMETVAGLWHKLDEKHKLRVNHSDHDLYTIENSYDQFHLNHKGAMRFTENMAAVFSQ